MKKSALIFTLCITLIIGLLSTGSFFIVDEREYCVQVRLKKVIRSVNEPGIYFRIPLVDDLIYYPSKAMNLDPQPENIVTGDQKKLIVDNYIKWKITDPEIFRNNLAPRSKAESRISSIALNALKDVMGSHTLHSIVSENRDSITAQALFYSQKQVKDLGVAILDIRFKSVDLPPSNIQKAFERMNVDRYKEAKLYVSRGEEEAYGIKAQTDLEKSTLLANSQKESAVIRAKVDAKVAEMYNEAYKKDPRFYEYYRSLKTLEKTIDTNTTLFISPKSSIYKYLNNP
jgi:membrane protease subunit HflC